MDEYNMRRFILTQALMADIEAMKAKNTLAELRKVIPYYNYDDFAKKAEELRVLAYTHDDQLF
jgi:hypothetical protein